MPTHLNLNLRQLAIALDGEVAGGQVLAPAPGHTRADRGMSIKLDTNAPGGFLVTLFNGGDPIAAKDYIRAKLGMEPWKPNGKDNGHAAYTAKPTVPKTVDPDRKAAAQARLKKALGEHDAKGPGAGAIVATYSYRAADGTLLYVVARLEPKTFRQRAADGSWNLDGVKRVPFLLPEMLADSTAVVHLAEGEKDTERLADLQLCATTISGGTKWTPDLAEYFRGRNVVILPDHDAAGVKRALEAANALHQVAASVRVVFLPDLTGKPGDNDVSDWLDHDPTRADKLADICRATPLWKPGVEVEGEAAAAAVKTKETPEVASKGGSSWRDRFKLTLLADVEPDADAPLWLIDGLIPAGPSLGVIFGKPKSGKTFLATALFLHVPMSREYCGCAVQAGAVVYITKEGVRGFKLRMVALRQYHKADARTPFYVAYEMPNFGTSCGDAEALVSLIRAMIPEGKPVAAVIIDTLARTMPGQSDSDGAAMSMFVENCETVARAFGCFVGAIHHSPRGDDTRSRGSNVLDGAADVIISVVKDDATGVSTAKIEALKDGEEGAAWRFRLIQIGIKVGEDRNKKDLFRPTAETIGTLIQKGETETKRNKKLSPAQRRMIDILAEAIIDHGQTVPGSVVIPRGIKAVSREQLKKCLLQAGFLDPEKPDAARSIFSRTLNDLAGKHVIGTTAEHVWLPQ